jgi:predicted nucleic acid-binding protein
VIAYIDSSVVLRIVLGQPERLREWDPIEAGVSSVLLEVECLRTLDRLRALAQLHDDELATRREAVYGILDGIRLVELTAPILGRAGQPFPTPVGTLDAIHLATALAWRDAENDDLRFLTHDTGLGAAARASGFEVMGI